MRLLFLLAAVFLLVALIWLGVTRAEQIYCGMILNKAIHEYSIHREEVAIKRALALLDRKPHYHRALETTIGWLVTKREFRRARSLAHDYPTTALLSSLTRYQLGVCAYETGMEEEAAALFATIDLTGKKGRAVPAPLVESYLSLAAGNGEAARASLEPIADRFENDPFYHSLVGRAGYSRGDVGKAAENLDRALELGDDNPNARLSLAVCRALLGDSPDMERLLDDLAAEGIDAYSLARGEVGSWLERLERVGRVVSPYQQATLREWRLNLRLARAALDVRQGRPLAAEETLRSLEEDFPDRVGLATRRGLLYERRQQPDAALELYRREAARFFLAAYKTAILEPQALPTSESELLRGYLPPESLVLDAAGMDATVGTAGDRGWALFAAGEISTTFTIRSTGRYAVNLLARGDSAADIWPIVLVFLDNNRVADLYINTPVWDLFELHRSLSAGPHSIRLLYINNAVPPGVGGDRNFYLDKVIVRPALN